jgi:hypothetical protein
MDRKGEWVPVEPCLRRSEEMPKEWDRGEREKYGHEIACIVGQPHLADSMPAPNNSRVWIDRFRDAINTNHDCCAFQRFQPGLSPKDHREMKLLAEYERILDAQRAEARVREDSWRAEEKEWRMATEQAIDRRLQEGEAKQDARLAKAEAGADARQSSANIFTGLGIFANIIVPIISALITVGALKVFGVF